jgi:hypothetical protein
MLEHGRWIFEEAVDNNVATDGYPELRLDFGVSIEWHTSDTDSICLIVDEKEG